MKEKRIAVKEMVSFLYSTGDLSKDFFANSDENEGKKAHLFLQNKYKENEIKEYYVSDQITIDDYEVTVNGFIDGVLENGSLLEEIKSTSLNLDEITISYHLEHLMQLKVYAYLYCKEKRLNKIRTRLKYISLKDYQTTEFYEDFDFIELSQFFLNSVKKYLVFVKALDNIDLEKEKTINDLKFPFKSYRKGQREFMKYIYQTIKEEGILYAIAPTGIGKTMASLFSSLKAMEGNNSKTFYLTAKSLEKNIAINTMMILKDSGLKIKTIELSSKDKMCLLEQRNCDAEVCPYAKGYFDRLHEALDSIIKEDLWISKTLKDHASKYNICPFEFSLDLSYYAHVIIADYNYAFDPRAHLIRYFDDTTYKPILLVDEAHNLPNRSREMYSASIKYSSLIPLRRALSRLKPSSRKQINDLIKYLDMIAEEDLEFNFQNKVPDKLVELTKKLALKIETVLQENKVFKRRNEVIETYYDILKFNRIMDFYGDEFRFVIEKNEDILFEIKCLNASKFLLEVIEKKAYGTILFSATLYPLDYYMELISKKIGESLQIASPFNPDNLGLIVKNNVSTKYSDRNKSVNEIIKTIDALISYKKGNYIVFFPSYAYMNLVLDAIKEPKYDIIKQTSNLSEEKRIETVNLFKNSDKTQVAFFVMGGVFSEGIDFIGDMLSGVLVVSASLPLYGGYNSLLSSYYDELINDGFNYAYTYPGFTKVVQAVGRVIRTEEDRGIAILLDHRFNTRIYRELMLPEWKNRVLINDIDEIKEFIKEFRENENK